MILLTQQEADSIKGEGGNGAKLIPFQYQGSWYLPEAVLNDNDYINQRYFLASLPLVDLEISDAGEV